MSGAPSEGQNGAETVVQSKILASKNRRAFVLLPPVGARILVMGCRFFALPGVKIDPPDDPRNLLSRSRGRG
eukprot:842323-Pyramimonas_sp.AAC.1